MDANDEGVGRDGVLILGEGRIGAKGGSGASSPSPPQAPPCPRCYLPSCVHQLELELILANHHHLVVGCGGGTRLTELPRTPPGMSLPSTPL